MQRRSFLGRAAAGAAAAAAVAAPAVVHAQATVRWRLASSFPKSLDTIYGAAEVFSKQVSAATGGKFTISVHAAGELVPAFGVVDGVQNGTVEAAHTAPYYFFGKDPTFAMDCAIPFGLNARQMTAWMYEGNGMKLFREFYRSFNIVNFPMGNTGAQMGGWLPQGDQVARRHEGPEDAHRRLRRQGAGASRLGAAEHSGRRDLHGAGEGHDRRRRVGRPVRRLQARLLQGSTVVRLPRLVGRRPAADACTSTPRPGTRCRPTTRRSSRPVPRMRTSSCWQPTTRRTRPR